MLNARSLKVVGRSRVLGKLRKPCFGTYCVAGLPRLFADLLGVAFSGEPLAPDVLPVPAKRYKKVIFLLIDGFGWNLVRQALELAPGFAALCKKGVLSKITSQFPSTTAAEVTTLYSGMPVAESGIFEWFYYEPVLDQVIAPLLFSPAGADRPKVLLESGVDPRTIFPEGRFFKTLAAAQVAGHIFKDKHYCTSPFSTVMEVGGVPHPFASVEQGLDELVNLANNVCDSAFFSLYIDELDNVSHWSGISSHSCKRVLRKTLALLDQRLFSKLKNDGETLLLLSADHGQIDVSPKDPVYINRLLPDFAKFLRMRQNAEPILFGGSARDIFLYVQEKFLPEAKAQLEQVLSGVADVYRIEELIELGLFGTAPLSQRLLDRVGNLVVLPQPGKQVFWYEKNKFKIKFRGNHGGLTPGEMEVPLLAVEF